MANITKKILRGASNTSDRTYQRWDTATDTNDSGGAISEGDVFRITDSLYRAADSCVITTSATGSASFRFNSVITIYPRRNDNEMGWVSSSYELVASGREFSDTSMAPVIVEAGSTFALNKEMNIDTITVVTKSGHFTLFVD